MNKRRKSCSVSIGNLQIGSCHPISIQSMTNTDTRDATKTVEQIIQLADAGCDIVRMAVQGKKEAYSCEAIKNTLIQKGYTIPLVADIHFYPPAALIAVDFVDKIRINPGNFADKRADFSKHLFTEKEYRDELQRIEEKFTPLILACRKQKKAMRLGVNHGSLSDRIMNFFGDTPRGMVESAIEYANICRKLDYHNFLFSMKSSNPLVMIEAYRTLVEEMHDKGWDYPLHLGVTEAGSGSSGRIKSSLGLATLIREGIGDTIRISLTEDPIKEISAAKLLLDVLEERQIEHGFHPLSHRDKTYLFLSKDHPSKKEIGVDGTFDRTNSQITIENKTYDLPILKNNDSLHFYTLLAKYPQAPFFALCNKESLVKIYKIASLAQKHQKKLLLLYDKSIATTKEYMALTADIGPLLVDQVIDGIISDGQTYTLCYERIMQLLQAARRKSYRTEFISCPSCGRTLFDLESVTKQIKKKTSHLPGVKIAIMGCIVNGPGEMADSDFGYVGAAVGKINLYVGKTCVEKNIDESDAVDALIALIKKHNQWIDPPLRDNNEFKALQSQSN